jgi:nucleoside-diphosphate-sugar epimerase
LIRFLGFKVWGFFWGGGGTPQCQTLYPMPPSQVICLDNFFTGSKENVAHLLPMPNFELIRHDVVEPILLEVDQIYHLACPASPVHYK